MHQLLENYFNAQVIGAAFPEVLQGFWVTVRAASCIIVLGLGTGLGLALLRYVPSRVLSGLIRVYVEIFRTMPQLMILIFIYFGLPYAGIRLSALFSTVVALAAVLAAFSAEIFWTSIVAVPRGQWEAALALGFRRPRALFVFILPQAIRLALPLVTNRTIAITKGTAFGVAVSLQETLGSAQSVMSMKANASPLTLAAGFYLLFFFPLVMFSRYTERRFSR